MRVLGWLLAMAAAWSLAACGGGDSSTTTLVGNGLNGLGQNPAVATPFVQKLNNLRVVVEDGPHGFQFSANANVLYATVTVCTPGGDISDPRQCQTIDHVQVDTGSVGLRVLASKVRALNLRRVPLAGTDTAWECYPFVIGGLWGANALADVHLGQQTASALSVQLIEDDANAAIQAPPDCLSASNGPLLDSASSLGANGILGIGSTTLDCGKTCLDGNYAGTTVLYYSCPAGAANVAACGPAPTVPLAMQVYNPVAAFAPSYNNGVVLKMPAVAFPGAASASGELIFGLDSVSDTASESGNRVPANARRIYLGVDGYAKPDSYLNVTTVFNGRTYLSSYLDTGTNGLFFDDTVLRNALCVGAVWYCPTAPQSTLALNAVISDAETVDAIYNPNLDPLLWPHPAPQSVDVNFQLSNAEVLFSTSNTAFSDVAGTAPQGSIAFAWGMPFFYGKQVYLSIWKQAGSLVAPWYAWAPL